MVVEEWIMTKIDVDIIYYLESSRVMRLILNKMKIDGCIVKNRVEMSQWSPVKWDGVGVSMKVEW